MQGRTFLSDSDLLGVHKAKLGLLYGRIVKGAFFFCFVVK